MVGLVGHQLKIRSDQSVREPHRASYLGKLVQFDHVPPGSVLLCSQFCPGALSQTYSWGYVQHAKQLVMICGEGGSWPARLFPVSSNNHNEWLGKMSCLRSFVCLLTYIVEIQREHVPRTPKWMCLTTGFAYLKGEPKA